MISNPILFQFLFLDFFSFVIFADILKKFIPKDPKCLEIFARYLLPNWTSYGLEAIRFQHESLFTVTNIDVQYKEVVTVKDSTCTSDVNRHKSEEAPTHSEAEVCNI